MKDVRVRGVFQVIENGEVVREEIMEPEEDDCLEAATRTGWSPMVKDPVKVKEFEAAVKVVNSAREMPDTEANRKALKLAQAKLQVAEEELKNADDVPNEDSVGDHLLNVGVETMEGFFYTADEVADEVVTKRQKETQELAREAIAEKKAAARAKLKIQSDQSPE